MEPRLFQFKLLIDLLHQRGLRSIRDHPGVEAECSTALTDESGTLTADGRAGRSVKRAAQNALTHDDSFCAAKQIASS